MGGSLGNASLFSFSGESLLLSSESGSLLFSGDTSLLGSLASGLLLCSDPGQLSGSPGCFLFLSLLGCLSGDAGLASFLLKLTLLGFLLEPLHFCKALCFFLSKSLLFGQSSGFLLGCKASLFGLSSESGLLCSFPSSLLSSCFLSSDSGSFLLCSDSSGFRGLGGQSFLLSFDPGCLLGGSLASKLSCLSSFSLNSGLLLSLQSESLCFASLSF